jgi:predicted RNA-binding protein with TRAM domain
MSDPGTTAPVQEGEEYIVEIAEQGDEGDGIAEIEEFVIVVPEADMGQRVTVEIDDVADSHATAAVVDPESDVGES